ncbi:MAG: peptidylprolyl isomerase [Candidatus Micrarchaeia archaeon]
MPKEGDFVKIDFTGATKDDGVVFDTTSEKRAREAGTFDPRVKYGPVLVPLGKHQILQGLEEELFKAKKGDEKTLTLAPEKAFGRKNSEEVRLVPLAKFQEQKVQPFVGMPVELDGRRARVQSVSGGRVRVDFNHPLADREIVYEYKVLDVLEKPGDKFTALADDLLPDAKVAYEAGVGTVDVPEKVDKFSREYLVLKTRFYVQATEFIPEVKKIIFKEECVPREKPAKAE